MVAFSVIVPVHNDGRVVERTLRSVDEAIRLACRACPPGVRLRPEVVVVDDGSVDETPRVVDGFVRGRDGFRVIRRASPSSAGTARNVGVAASTGDLLFFLDGDDVFLEDHIVACLRVMADDAIDYVETGIALSDPVHPDWYGRIRNSVVINLCVRRRCHDRIGGFLDYHLFRRDGDRFDHECDAYRAIEDVFYNRMLRRCCRGVLVEAATVKHFRYPGNSFDRQYEKFRRPYGAYREEVAEGRDFQVRLAELLLEHHQRRIDDPRRRAGDGRPCVIGVGRGPTREAAPAAAGGPTFAADWPSPRTRDWPRHLAPFVGKPGLAFLEVGCSEGWTTLWLLANVLTHPTARITCVDTFAGGPERRGMAIDAGGVEGRFDCNVASSGVGEKVAKLHGTSQEVLRGLPLRRYDFASIDGSREARDVLEDAVLCRRLLKVGAVLILGGDRRDQLRGDPRHPEVAIDLFMQLYGDGFEVIELGDQAVLRKVADP